jgi:hypothetical protein
VGIDVEIDSAKGDASEIYEEPPVAHSYVRPSNSAVLLSCLGNMCLKYVINAILPFFQFTLVDATLSYQEGNQHLTDGTISEIDVRCQVLDDKYKLDIFLKSCLVNETDTDAKITPNAVMKRFNMQECRCTMHLVGRNALQFSSTCDLIDICLSSSLDVANKEETIYKYRKHQLVNSLAYFESSLKRSTTLLNIPQVDINVLELKLRRIHNEYKSDTLSFDNFGITCNGKQSTFDTQFKWLNGIFASNQPNGISQTIHTKQVSLIVTICVLGGLDDILAEINIQCTILSMTSDLTLEPVKQDAVSTSTAEIESKVLKGISSGNLLFPTSSSLEKFLSNLKLSIGFKSESLDLNVHSTVCPLRLEVVASKASFSLTWPEKFEHEGSVECKGVMIWCALDSLKFNVNDTEIQILFLSFEDMDHILTTSFELNNICHILMQNDHSTLESRIQWRSRLGAVIMSGKDMLTVFEKFFDATKTFSQSTVRQPTPKPKVPFGIQMQLSSIIQVKIQSLDFETFLRISTEKIRHFRFQVADITSELIQSINGPDLRINEIKCMSQTLSCYLSACPQERDTEASCKSQILHIEVLNYHYRTVRKDLHQPSQKFAATIQAFTSKYSIQHHFLAAECLRHLRNQPWITKPHVKDERTAVPDLIRLKLTINLFSLEINLLSSSLLIVTMNKSRIVSDGVNSELMSERFSIKSTLRGTNNQEEIFLLTPFSYSRARIGDKDSNQNLSKLDSSDLKITLPNEYKLGILHQDLVEMWKIVKWIQNKGPSKPDLGTNKYQLHISRIAIKMRENSFEESLSRIFFLGHLEQLQRIERLQAFSRKLQLETIPTPEVDIAYSLLLQYNSQEWIRQVKKYKTFPTFFSLDLEEFNLSIQQATLVESSLPKEIHRLDSSTPESLIYSTLIGRNIEIQVAGILIQFRDYSTPFVFLSNEDASDLSLTGLIILSEEDEYANVSLRKSVDIGFDTSVNIQFNTSPTKLYVDLAARLNSSTPLLLSYGPCYAGAFFQLSRSMSMLTKPSLDPNEPLSWWDKVRLMIHGKIVGSASERSEVRFRLLGSRDPYYEDGIRDGGNSGIDLSFRGNLQGVLGNCSELQAQKGRDWQLTIRCLESLWSTPFPVLTKQFGTDYLKPNLRQQHFRKTMCGQIEDAQVVMSLANGVVYSISFNFVSVSGLKLARRTAARTIIRGHSELRAQPFHKVDNSDASVNKL